MILIGSRALAYQIEKLENRIDSGTDYDALMSVEEFMKWQYEHDDDIVLMTPRSANKYKVIVKRKSKRIQYEIELGIEDTSTKLLLDHISEVCKGKTKGFFGEEFDVLSLEYQMLTKRSHLIYPIHFEKNIKDYHIMKKRLGYFKKDELMESYYDLRYKETALRVNQKTPKLNVTTEDFFSSKLPVPNYFVHDHIHEIMAHHKKPIYKMMQKDDSKAWCEKDMFFDLPYEYQVQAVQEEAYVIALERYIIPQHGENHNDSFDCYKRAVKRICTTLTSGWFRDFAIENYDKVLNYYNPRFVDKFIANILLDKINPVNGYKLKDIPLIQNFRI